MQDKGGFDPVAFGAGFDWVTPVTALMSDRPAFQVSEAEGGVIWIVLRNAGIKMYNVMIVDGTYNFQVDKEHELYVARLLGYTPQQYQAAEPQRNLSRMIGKIGASLFLLALIGGVAFLILVSMVGG